ncbi:hypothetical protein NDU88_008763, partial [Pleurodeles waltl]
TLWSYLWRIEKVTVFCFYMYTNFVTPCHHYSQMICGGVIWLRCLHWIGS